jgi:hypothetical protein
MVRHLKLCAGSDLAETSLAGEWHSHCIAGDVDFFLTPGG